MVSERPTFSQRILDKTSTNGLGLYPPTVNGYNPSPFVDLLSDSFGKKMVFPKPNTRVQPNSQLNREVTETAHRTVATVTGFNPSPFVDLLSDSFGKTLVCPIPNTLIQPNSQVNREVTETGPRNVCYSKWVQSESLC